MTEDSAANIDNIQDYSLLAPRAETRYTPDEERFSVLLHDRVEALLEGRRNRLPLMRRYLQNGDRLGIMPTPPEVNREGLRLPVIEHMLTDVLLYLHDGTRGGPPSREHLAGDRVVETQRFTTKWPHIALVRTDVFHAKNGTPMETTWLALRVQNQRRLMYISRMFDIANLSAELLQIIGLGR